MGKGKNPLNHFGSVVMNFRAAEQVACGDMQKMFNQIKVREQDQHLRRFFVRPDGFDGKEPLREAVITCINFGEKAAGGVATAVKDRCAEDNKEINSCSEMDLTNDLLRTFTPKEFVKTFVDFEVRSKFDKNLINGIMRERIKTKESLTWIERTEVV